MPRKKTRSAGLADSSLKLSREIERLEARYARERDACERARDRALVAMEPAKRILERYHRGLARAKQIELQTIEKVNQWHDRQIRSAETKRRSQLALDERKYRDGRKKADAKRRRRVASAKASWTKAVGKLHRRPLADQRPLRKASDDRLSETLERARLLHHQSIENDRLSHQSAIQDSLVAERLTVERARRQSGKLVAGAAVGYERAIAQEEARMRRALSAIPKAGSVQEAHDRRLLELHQACEAEKDAVFRSFAQKHRSHRRK